MADDPGYAQALERGRQIYAPLRIGRPGRPNRAVYWAVFALLRLLRIPVKVDLAGRDRMASGSAILVMNHLSALDPVIAMTRMWFRAAAFTKVEAYESAGGFFFRWVGQIPLRRGDQAATEWALDMAHRALEDGVVIGIYPEGTRGPDHGALYRLSPRVLVPLVQQNPDVPVHVLATTYSRPGLRLRARLRVSAPLPVDGRTMTGEEIVAVLRDALMAEGGLRYVDEYAFVAKARARAAAKAEQAGSEAGSEAGSVAGSVAGSDTVADRPADDDDRPAT